MLGRRPTGQLFCKLYYPVGSSEIRKRQFHYFQNIPQDKLGCLCHVKCYPPRCRVIVLCVCVCVRVGAPAHACANWHVHARVCVRVQARVGVRVRMCVPMCARAHVRARVSVCGWVQYVGWWV